MARNPELFFTTLKYLRFFEQAGFPAKPGGTYAENLEKGALSRLATVNSPRRVGSVRRQPEPQAKGDDGYGADAGEPQRRKPQQPLCQRCRLSLPHQ
jgi:hypothetical protein